MHTKTPRGVGHNDTRTERLNRPIDLLRDRQADTVAAWLKAHPGVEIVARDRAGAYADGIRQGAPDAIQVADRWHLLRNLGDALRELLTGHQRDLRTAAQRAVAPAAIDRPEPPVAKARPATRSEQRRAATRAARLARYDEVAALNARGWSQTRIAQTLDLDRKTVRVWLRAGQPSSWDQPAKGSVLDPFTDHLSRPWVEGCHNVARLWREIRALGFAGQRSVVRDWARPRRQATPAAPSDGVAPWRTPSRRRAAWLVVADDDEIKATERAFVAALIAGAPKLTRTITVAREFRALVRGKQGDALDGVGLRPPTRPPWPASPRASSAIWRRCVRRCRCPGAPGRWRDRSAS